MIHCTRFEHSVNFVASHKIPATNADTGQSSLGWSPSKRGREAARPVALRLILRERLATRLRP